MTKASRHNSAPASVWPDGLFPGSFFSGSATAGAATPIAAMALFNLNAMCAGLQAARQLLDASRETIRKQQDMAIEAWRAQLERLTVASGTGLTDQAREFFNPMSATGVFRQMSDAAMQAQREALRPFMEAPKPH